MVSPGVCPPPTTTTTRPCSRSPIRETLFCARRPHGAWKAMQMVAGGSRLPSGTVTFVFTDIEGSTRLIRNLGERYAPALDRHREILREAWRRHRGHEVDTEGDS